jgi:hypothetical protein
MVKLTKKELAALQEFKDFLDNLENNRPYVDAIYKIKEARDKAQEKDKPTEKDEAWMEMGTAADAVEDALVPDLIENLGEIIGLAEQ